MNTAATPPRLTGAPRERKVALPVHRDHRRDHRAAGRAEADCRSAWTPPNGLVIWAAGHARSAAGALRGGSTTQVEAVVVTGNQKSLGPVPT
ncbi:hypothetical protein QJS66_12000 [Kocuria rhizophila]|nr:hypothetical protein QJS66_12000 [Kocuria rhizophila]